MPRQDRTGPLGEGPSTGWGRGPCGQGLRRGFGRGRGLGRGYGWRASEPLNLSKEEEKKILKEEAEDLETELKRIKQKIEELERDN